VSSSLGEATIVTLRRPSVRVLVLTLFFFPPPANIPSPSPLQPSSLHPSSLHPSPLHPSPLHAPLSRARSTQPAPPRPLHPARSTRRSRAQPRPLLPQPRQTPTHQLAPLQLAPPQPAPRAALARSLDLRKTRPTHVPARPALPSSPHPQPRSSTRALDVLVWRHAHSRLRTISHDPTRSHTTHTAFLSLAFPHARIPTHPRTIPHERALTPSPPQGTAGPTHNNRVTPYDPTRSHTTHTAFLSLAFPHTRIPTHPRTIPHEPTRPHMEHLTHTHTHTHTHRLTTLCPCPHPTRHNRSCAFCIVCT